jgi:hypothetical protein
MVGFLKKILGGSKEDYYLQLDESQETESTPAQPTESTAENTATAAATEQKETKAPEVKTEQPAPQPKPLPVISSTNGKIATAQPEIVGFAPDNLMPTPTNTRRRPGPSLGMFKDMARQVNPNLKK